VHEFLEGILVTVLQNYCTNNSIDIDIENDKLANNKTTIFNILGRKRLDAKKLS
jgi:hypothetical protein